MRGLDLGFFGIFGRILGCQNLEVVKASDYFLVISMESLNFSMENHRKLEIFRVLDKEVC